GHVHGAPELAFVRAWGSSRSGTLTATTHHPAPKLHAVSLPGLHIDPFLRKRKASQREKTLRRRWLHQQARELLQVKTYAEPYLACAAMLLSLVPLTGVRIGYSTHAQPRDRILPQADGGEIFSPRICLKTLNMGP
ncbi:unnamed protein product, partial [Ectocarpus sp. 12 AP-2014]